MTEDRCQAREVQHLGEKRRLYDTSQKNHLFGLVWPILHGIRINRNIQACEEGWSLSYSRPHMLVQVRTRLSYAELLLPRSTIVKLKQKIFSSVHCTITVSITPCFCVLLRLVLFWMRPVIANSDELSFSEDTFLSVVYRWDNVAAV